MAGVNVRVDTQPVDRYLTDINREHVPFASAIALTKTAVYARQQIIAEMPRVFDRPKPSTVNETRGPLYLKTADYRKLKAGINDYAEVRVKDTPQVKGDPALVYLSHNIRGGARVEKRSEALLRRAGILNKGQFAVPGSGARLDRYGNMSSGQVQQILAALGASRETRQNTRYRGSGVIDSRGKDHSRSVQTQRDYFIANRNNPRTAHLPEGVWQRYGRSRFAIRPVLIFVQGAPRYRRRLRFFEIGESVAQYRYPREFHLAMRHALATAKVQPNRLLRAA